MENPHQDDILTITISVSGAATLKRLVGSTRILFLLGCIMSVLELVVIYFRYSWLALSYYKSNFFLYLQLVLTPFYTIVFIVFVLLQIFQFLKFTRLSNASIGLGNSEAFNQSFTFLQRYNRIGIINCSIGMLMLILELIVEWQYFSTKN
jgi:hypothetical protein